MTITQSTKVGSPPLRDHRVPGDTLVEGPRTVRRLAPGQVDKPYQLFELAPLGPLLGAEIRGLDLSRPLTPALREELHRALLEWKVLFFRAQRLSSRAQRDFARTWGELETNPFLATGDDSEVARFDRNALPTFENVWHADTTFRENPSLGAVLQLHQLPPAGGDTMWADMGAAYDNLPPEVRERVDGLRAVHDFLPGFARFAAPEQLARFQEEFPPVEHPVVRVHPETGRRTLFVNVSFTTRIVGLEREESDRLLRQLFQQAHLPEVQVRYRWRPGDIAFWDNRATQHYAVNDYAPHRRVAERVAIVGDRPY
ncbi:TauD/TfdA family dioxygenase [Streptomyces sp. NPDC005438]|uniref:TauD/TfdA dioxygenase family protein n=1 Tax=Streptomyces sp. NPDC005438 TaxID=3156880 RepID=UPI0033B2357E